MQQQNQNWPFLLNEFVSPYFDAYSQYMQKMFTSQPTFSNDFLIKNAHHTLDFMKQMMFIFEENLVKPKSRRENPVQESQGSNMEGLRAKNTLRKTSVRKATKTGTKLKSSTKSASENNWANSEIKTNGLGVKKRKAPVKKAKQNVQKNEDHPYALGERSHGINPDLGFKPTTGKAPFTSKNKP